MKDLVLPFCPSLRAHINLLPVSSSFDPAFLRVFKEKIRLKKAIMLYMNDTLDEEDVLIMSWKSKTHLRGDDFSSKFPCQRQRQRVSRLRQRISRLRYMSRINMHVDYD